jgi:DNA-binding transcriptional ArsR family regulator
MAGKRSAAAARVASTPPRPARRPAPDRPQPARLDRLIHDRTRLAIVSALAVNDVLTFVELKALTDATDGNLSVHARRLEEGGYLACTKSFDGRVPRTEFRVTETGRQALARYLDHMEAIIHHARNRARKGDVR